MKVDASRLAGSIRQLKLRRGSRCIEICLRMWGVGTASKDSNHTHISIRLRPLIRSFTRNLYSQNRISRSCSYGPVHNLILAGIFALNDLMSCSSISS